MASIAFDSSGSRDGSRSPISLHPAFPAVVALWFAALLGWVNGWTDADAVTVDFEIAVRLLFDGLP